ncbi:hypothetical protein ACOME3_000784 [Neoechinorhynchus agilis]
MADSASKMIAELKKKVGALESDEHRRVAVAEHKYLSAQCSRLVQELKDIEANVANRISDISKKVQEKDIEQPASLLGPKKLSKVQKPPSPVDISRFDLRIGHIEKVERHPNADKLYVSLINVGESSPRTVCSGLVGHIEQSDLENSMAIVLCNLKAAKIRGIKSEAMIMCANETSASGEYTVKLLKVDGSTNAGDRVTCDGFENECYDKSLQSQVVFQILKDLKTNERCEGCYKGHILRVKDVGVVVAEGMPLADIK